MAGKQYGSPEQYEEKLRRVMERFQADDWDYDWNRKGNCWIRFEIEGESFYFQHSVEQAREAGIKLQYGSDAFAQLVLTLEDLARANERRTFTLKKVLRAVAALEPPKEVPSFFVFMGFDRVPDAAELTARYRALAKQMHPDNKESGSQEDFEKLQRAMEQAKKYFDK